jgi:thiol-disulfide isomerase/thioredoxin
MVVAAGGDGSGKTAAATDVQVDGPARVKPLVVGAQVPDFSAPGLEGGRVSWTDALGKPTALVVWASWCPHCQRELPFYSRVAASFPTVKVLTVTTAIGLYPGPTPQEFVRGHGLQLAVAVDDSRNTIAWALGVRSYPTTYWVGPEGRVRGVLIGEVGEASIRESFHALAAMAQ